MNQSNRRSRSRNSSNQQQYSQPHQQNYGANSEHQQNQSYESNMGYNSNQYSQNQNNNFNQYSQNQNNNFNQNYNINNGYYQNQTNENNSQPLYYQNQPQNYSMAENTTNNNNASWYAPPPQNNPNSKKKNNPKNKQPKQEKPPKKKGYILWQLLKIGVILGVIAALAFGGQYISTNNEVEVYENVFLSNISVDGISLDGLTWEEGSNKVWEQINQKKDGWYVRLSNGAGQYSDITADMLGITFDPSIALAKAWEIGHDVDHNNRKDTNQILSEVENSENNISEFFSAKQNANTQPIEEILTTLEQNAYVEPVNAQIISYNPDNLDEPFTYSPEKYGQYLDVASATSQILEYIHNLQSGEVVLQTQPLEPSVTVADLKAITSLRATIETPIAKYSSEERNKNIELSFSRINGLVLQPGEKFKFNDIVGKRSFDNGFYPAIEYAYGQEVMGIGGGVCQASTSMYLAASEAGLEILEREAHSNPVSYTLLGLDATVSDTVGREIDFIFKNNTSHPIYISSHIISTTNNSKNLVCRVNIYGEDLGNVKYIMESNTVKTIPMPLEPLIFEDEDMSHVTFTDEREQIAEGREGWIVETYLVKLENNQEVSRELIATDRFEAKADQYVVGTVQRGS